jgi:predicted ester cyclase
MTKTELANFYQGYIACLNHEDWDRLGHFVHPDVTYNARPIGLAGYRANAHNPTLAVAA